MPSSHTSVIPAVQSASESHVSSPLQTSKSSQTESFAVYSQPDEASQLSAVQPTPSSHTTAS